MNLEQKTTKTAKIIFAAGFVETQSHVSAESAIHI
jgi:hypothetical protein